MNAKKLLICFLTLCLLLCACGKTAPAQGERTGSESQTEQTTGVGETSSAPAALPTNAATNTQTPSGSAQATKASAGNAGNSGASSGSGSKTSGNSAANAQKTPVATATQPQKQNTISLSITCKNAINNGILDDPNYAGVLPENGVIFSSDAVKIESGDTVMQVVKSTLKANKIVYQIASDGYIKSISGLGEFDRGAQSGWLYKVNGVSPSISTRYYTLKPGDRVELIYTCKQGDVS